MANDTPGSDARSVARHDETTFSARPDVPPPGNPADPDATALDTERPARSGSSPWAPDDRSGRGAGDDRPDRGTGDDAAHRRDDGSRYDVPQAAGPQPGPADPSARGGQDASPWSGGTGAVPQTGGAYGPGRGSVQGTGGFGAVRGGPAGGGPGGSSAGQGPYGPGSGERAAGDDRGSAQGGGAYGPGQGGSGQGGGVQGSGAFGAQGGGYGPPPTGGMHGAAQAASSPYGGAGQSRPGGPGSYSTGAWGSGSYGGGQGGGQGGEPARGGTAVYGPGGTGQQPAVGRGGPSTGQLPAVGWAPGPPPEQRRRRGPGWAALLVVGLVAALLGGAAGAFGPGLLGTDRTSGGSPGVLGAPVPDVEDASAPIGPVEAVAERVLPSVVQLRVQGQGQAGEGSGIVLSADGLILTNNHVVEAASAGGSVTVVFQDGQTAPAQIVGLDPTSDLAVIRAQGRTDLTPAELGNSDAVRVGQQVVAFGSPLGLGGTVTTGIISAVDRAVSVGEESGASEATVLNALQTDAAINPGNSGGPLTDMEGRIIGINSVIATTGQQGGSIGVGFAIPVNQARRIATELEATGSATRAVLGVSLAPDDERSLAGAVVQAVTPGGAAEAAGIVAGDVIVRFGDQRVTNGTELQAAVRSHTPGEVVEVQLADRTIQVTPTGESG
jgi:putative serine protease PepD